jgi:hypothetical protein
MAKENVLTKRKNAAHTFHNFKLLFSQDMRVGMKVKLSH